MIQTGNPQLDELIQREIRYNQTRWTEVWLACIMFVFGAVLVCPGETFSLPSYRVVASYLNEDTTGLLLMSVGTARLSMLYVNGRMRQTPAFRMAGCMFGFAFWLPLALGFVFAAPPLGLGPILFVFAVAELHSSGRAARDAVRSDAFGTRRRRRTAERTGRSWPARAFPFLFAR